MSEHRCTIRRATHNDLPVINELVELAILEWDLPERVRHLALPSYRYAEHELTYMHLTVAERGLGHVVGAAAWEPADPAELPEGKTGMLLHGIYVHPHHQHHGIGRQLLHAALADAARAGLDGLLAKSQPDARGFYLSHGMDTLPVLDPARDYPYRYWLAL